MKLTEIQKVLLKSWIVKTSIFLLAFIALLSFTLLKIYGLSIYTEKIQLGLGEIFVTILLLQFLMTKKCIYSWVTIFLLLFNQLVNLANIFTILNQSIYIDILVGVNYIIALVLSITYIIKDNLANKRAGLYQENSTKNVLKIGGGVAIGRKPTHCKEIINNKTVFIDLSEEGRYSFEVYNTESFLLKSEKLNYTNYEEIISIITEQTNQI